MSIKLVPKTALWLFITMIVFLVAQAVWWIAFIATLVDEKVELAQKLGASTDFIENIHREEISRQIMIGSEGVFFLLVLLLGLWLIYRSLIKMQELKFQQQNFLMAVTHELKTPLASIKVYLDSLQSPKIPAGRKEQVIPNMKEDILRLQKLVDNILLAGQFERTEHKMKFQRFNLTKLVEQSIISAKQFPLDKDIEIISDLTPDVMFEGDIKSLQRALDAILENALKYNEGNKIIIKVRLFVQHNSIILEIADNGMGLEKKNYDFIFERFARVGNELTRYTDGTGLGLYLCREIIHAHRGNISVHSDGLGKGTVFTITLNRIKGSFEKFSRR